MISEQTLPAKITHTLFEIDKELYKELEKLEEKRAKEKEYGFVNFTKD